MMKRVCNDHDYCYIEMPNDNNKISRYNHGEKLMKALFIIYASLECLLKKGTHIRITLKNLIQNNLHKVSGY